MEIFDPAELWNKEQIESVQLARLKNALARARNCAFYRERLDQAGIGPDSLRSPDDLRRIPFTTKQDLRAQYPSGLLCVPPSEIVRMHCSSGTTGAPVAVCHTQNDVNVWADLMARCLYMAGVRREDVFQNMSGYGLFTGGLGIHFGAERLGCMTIPAGAGNTRRQIKLIRDFRTTVVHILPSYALILGEYLRSNNENPRDLPLRIAIVGAEPYTEEFRGRVEDLFGIKIYNSYGLSEMNGPGVGFECAERNGLHIWEDAYIAEVVEPETGRPVPVGEVGELVMTSLCREGMPILRYRTRDLTRFLPGECACGRAHRRVDRILGRTDDMFIIKGVNVYPMQIEEVLMAFPEVGQNYLILLENDGVSDMMRVQVEVRDEYFVEDMRILQNLQKAIARRLRAEILLTPRVELVESNSLPRAEGKAVRVRDSRDNK
ncbi:MAG: phenylacetate--CoA ligase [Desulfovibrio sp.]|jgi:phenylacetate-CoA ligase|nr:phenylacetate--CoA ligase [Desulfovibrio sp.]